MTDQDIKLIGELRTELAGWQQRAQDAMAAAEQNRARITELEALVEQLRCGDLVAFGDGALTPERREAYREHLVRCADCQRGLEDNLAIEASMSAAARPRTPR